ncbi:MAG: RHS repeat-associated core domain-containing protein [Bacteroidota bacterium]|nr:RHS repeat-associated core domain-containing protein [Bacteroidota bacterium]
MSYDTNIGGNEDFTYDPEGNRLTDSGVTGEWTYNQNNELTGYDNASYVYDDNGNMTQKTVAGVVTKFFYNTEDRLSEVRDGSDALIASYYYDPFGRRLWKEVSGFRTYFMYSDEGLIGEYDSTGNEIKAYGYKPNSTWTTDPLFMKIGTEYYFYHNDHLGTPQKMTAVNGAVVWSATYTSFGNAEVDPSSTITNNLRFPGQYEDQETALHYNGHRYYDPNTGRYLRLDPIGLEGGINLFTYTTNNPINAIDPLGLLDIPEGFWEYNKNRFLPSEYYQAPNEAQKYQVDQFKKRFPFGWNNRGYSELGRIMSESMMSGELTAYDKCLNDCLMKAILGYNPISPVEGELKTYAITKSGQKAIERAAKKGLKTVVVKIGSKAVPGLSAVSTTISLVKFTSCASKCEECQ